MNAEANEISLKANQCKDNRTRVLGDLSFFPSGTICQLESRARTATSNVTRL